MKKYTQGEFNAFPVVDGCKQCSTGDYTEIKVFGERCSFENNKKFKPGIPFIRVNNIGSRGDGCQIFNFTDGLYVRCGCWAGSVEDFVTRVKERHAGTVHERTYLLAVAMAKSQFGG